MSNAFQSVFNTALEACQQADLSGNGFMPPEGEYNVTISQVKKKEGTVKKAGKMQGRPFVSVSVGYTILDGEFEGRTFWQNFFLPAKKADEDLAFGFVQMLSLATLIANEEVKNPAEALGTIEGAATEGVQMTIVRKDTDNKNNPDKPYENIYPGKLLN